MRMWARAYGHSRTEPARKPVPAVVGCRTQFFSLVDPGPSRDGALFGPVDEQLTLRKQPTVALLHERVEVAERCNHQAALSLGDGYVVCQAVGFPNGLVVGQREDRALSDEMGGGVVLVEVREDRSERIP